MFVRACRINHNVLGCSFEYRVFYSILNSTRCFNLVYFNSSHIQYWHSFNKEGKIQLDTILAQCYIHIGDLEDMKSFALLLFIFLIQPLSSQAAKFDFDEHEGRAVVLILVIAALVCLVSLILFIYILYKIWNGKTKHYYYNKSIDTAEKDVELNDVTDGGSDYYTTTTDPLYASVNKGVAEETVLQENGTVVVEARVEEDELTTEEVIVTQAPLADHAEMETQELVIVFDNNDDVVDVFTHVET